MSVCHISHANVNSITDQPSPIALRALFPRPFQERGPSGGVMNPCNPSSPCNQTEQRRGQRKISNREEEQRRREAEPLRSLRAFLNKGQSREAPPKKKLYNPGLNSCLHLRFFTHNIHHKEGKTHPLQQQHYKIRSPSQRQSERKSGKRINAHLSTKEEHQELQPQAMTTTQAPNLTPPLGVGGGLRPTNSKF